MFAFTQTGLSGGDLLGPGRCGTVNGVEELVHRPGRYGLPPTTRRSRQRRHASTSPCRHTPSELGVGCRRLGGHGRRLRATTCIARGSSGEPVLPSPFPGEVAVAGDTFAGR